MPRKKKVVGKKSTEKTEPTQKEEIIKETGIVQADNSEITDDFYSSDESALKNILLAWKSPEFVYHPKSFKWHLFVFLTLAIIIVISFFMQQWFAIVVFLLAAVVLIQYAETKPKVVDVVLTSFGMQFGTRFYAYNSIKSFWIVYSPEIKILNFEPTKRFLPIITIQLEDVDPFQVKNILKDYILEETERTEDIFDKIVRYLKF